MQAFDVHPTLGTYRHPGGISNLDRCLVPEEWVSSARWNPTVYAIEPRGLQGHFMLKLQVRLKPAVINCPRTLSMKLFHQMSSCQAKTGMFQGMCPPCTALFAYCIARGMAFFSICQLGMVSLLQPLLIPRSMVHFIQLFHLLVGS